MACDIDRGVVDPELRKIMKNTLLVFLAVLFIGTRAMGAHIDDVVCTITIPDDYSDEIEEILSAMPALMEEDGEGNQAVVEETTEEKVKRFSSQLLERYWEQKILKLRRYKATLDVESAGDLTVE